MKRTFGLVMLTCLMLLPASAMGAGGAEDTIGNAAYADIKDWDPSIATDQDPHPVAGGGAA